MQVNSTPKNMLSELYKKKQPIGVQMGLGSLVSNIQAAKTMFKSDAVKTGAPTPPPKPNTPNSILESL